MTIQTHAATDAYRDGWDAVFGGPRKPDERAIALRKVAIARVECRKLLPKLPAADESHVAVPLWMLRALVGVGP